MLSQLAFLPAFAEPEQKAGIASDGAGATVQAHTTPFSFTAPVASTAAAGATVPAKASIPAHQ